MLWMIPLATAALGAKNAAEKRAAQRNNNKQQAEITKYSPWTGMSGQIDTSYSPDALTGAVSGGLQGMGMMQGLGGLGGQTPSPADTDLSANMFQQSMNQAQPMQQQPSLYNPNMSSWNFGGYGSV